MPKIKEVPSTEVHWQVGNWNVRDAANARIRQTMGADAVYFAPVYVTYGSYYWSDPDVEGWLPLSSATPDDVAEARALIGTIKANALKKYPSRASILEQVFTFPNDDFIFVRRRAGEQLEMRLTGWGFANYNRARGTVITETLTEDKINEITLSFSIDGSPVPNRAFQFARGMAWVDATTDDSGNYSFGCQTPGSTVSVRDVATGVERVTEITSETAHIDVDVTEYLTVRIVARYDDRPLSGESARLNYGHRSSPLALTQGVAGCTLPWLEGVVCEIELRGEKQKRELRKETVNEFVFDFHTPRIPHTRVEVALTDNGAPIAGERVALVTPAGVMNVLTDANGLATYEFDIPETGGNVSVTVRDRSESRPAVDGTVRFDMAFDTPPAIEFDAYLRVVNVEGEVMPFYPVNVDLNDGNGLVECLTDENGLIGPIPVVSGNSMTAYDGNDNSLSETFDLVAEQQEYIFELPYESAPNLGDVRLRVIQRNKVPAIGATCILQQGDKRIVATLDNRGEMTFGSDDFSVNTPVEVSLYSTNRNFPHLQLPLTQGETEYELYEVDGPQPWWHIAGEIALAACGILALVGGYFALDSFLYSLPNFFA